MAADLICPTCKEVLSMENDVPLYSAITCQMCAVDFIVNPEDVIPDEDPDPDVKK